MSVATLGTCVLVVALVVVALVVMDVLFPPGPPPPAAPATTEAGWWSDDPTEGDRTDPAPTWLSGGGMCHQVSTSARGGA